MAEFPFEQYLMALQNKSNPMGDIVKATQSIAQTSQPLAQMAYKKKQNNAELFQKMITAKYKPYVMEKGVKRDVTAKEILDFSSGNGDFKNMGFDSPDDALLMIPSITEIEAAKSNGVTLTPGQAYDKKLILQYTKPKAAAGKPEEIRVLFDASTGSYFDPQTRQPVDVLDEKYQGKKIVKDIFTPNKPMTSEAGGKVALANLGLQSLKEARETLMPGGTLDKGVLAGASLGKPIGGVGERGRIVFSKINDAVEAKLRAETGAAATTDEINRIAKRYYPNYLLDTEATIKDKFDRLETFLKLARVTVDPSGKYNIEEPKPSKSKKGTGTLMIDGKGNKAMVYEDGTIEEIE